MEPASDAGIAAALGLKPLTILAGAVGGFISLNVFGDQPIKVRWLAAVCGTGLAYLTAEPLTIWAGVPPKVETVFAVFIAIFGMSLVTAFAKAIKEIKWADVFWAVLGKFGIKRPGGQDGG